MNKLTITTIDAHVQLVAPDNFRVLMTPEQAFEIAIDIMDKAKEAKLWRDAKKKEIEK